METVIVTGCAGFIGSHLSEKLLEGNFKVIGIDCFTDYYSRTIKENNIKNCLKNENFSLIDQNLMDLDLESIFKKSPILFHLAAQPGVRSSWGEQFSTYVTNNILVTQRILEYAKKNNVFKKIVLASSSSVYGNQNGKMNEDSTLTKPLSPYGSTKLASENLGSLYYHNFELPVTSFRFFTVYGPRQRPDMAFTRFINAALKGKEITVYGDGNQRRDFTYIEDIVSGMIASMDHAAKGEIINLGGGHVVSVNETLEIIKNITDKDLRVSYKEKQKGDVDHTEADISKASKILEFKPKTTINDGLVKQTEYIKENLDFY
jgi:UDP-glucose 4-epimerase